MAGVLFRGFLLGLVIAASPGPISFLCLRRTLSRGWLTGLVSGLGVASADAFYAAVAAFGIGAVTSAIVGDRRWLALIGGAVLIVLGLRAVLDRPSPSNAPDHNSISAERAPSPVGSGLVWAYLSTLGLTIANPSTIIAFAALVASLGIGISGGFLSPALFALGAFVGSATWWCVLAALGAGLRARVTPRVVRGVSTFSGLGILALGVVAVLSTLAS